MKNKFKKLVIGTAALTLAVLSPAPASQVLPSTAITAEAATTKLAVSKKTIKVGATYKLKLKNNTKKVKWSRSNKNVTLSNKSKTSVTVTGKKAGNSVVKAKVNGKTYKCTFTVKEAPKISSATLNLPAGASGTLTITGASSKPVWSIANGNIASLRKVSKYVYTVTGKRAGTTLVTVKVAGKTRTCKIYVSGTTTVSNASTGGCFSHIWMCFTYQQRPIDHCAATINIIFHSFATFTLQSLSANEMPYARTLYFLR